MGDWIIYLLQVAVCHALLVLFYILALRKLTFYGFNRAYLLGVIPLGFVLPLVNIQVPVSQETSEQVVEMIATRVAQVSEQPVVEQIVAQPIDYMLLASLIYASGMIFFLGRYFINYFKIKKLKNQYPLINQSEGVSVFRTSLTQPFSFFKSVFVPSNIGGKHAFDLVMTHEMWHVRLAHSFDRMLVDFILVLFWFNPFIYFLRKLLIELHEYQVDSRISSDFSVKISYQQLLLQLAGGRLSGPVSFFNFSTIKQRIEMMNRNQSNRFSLLRIVLLLPLLGGMTMLFSFELVKLNRPELLTTITESLDHTPVDIQETILMILVTQESNIPSILPLQLTKDKINVTSHFGMRYDPTAKKKKHHNGIDFRAAVGTPIIATADGKVSVSEEFDNWGKRIDIEHADGLMTRYAHLSELGVKAGEIVKKGQVIGATGNTGLSTAPHLHYSVYKDDKSVNPVDYIKDFKFETKATTAPKEPEPTAAPEPSQIANAELVPLHDED